MQPKSGMKKPEGDPIPLFKEPFEIEEVMFMKKPIGGI